ncbi:MAG: DUF4281 domain-containing protein [Bosea sp.]|jgi:hypothetical protein|nr:DUF4281 domain-containing protein [Bosea sp. (in: a-proteobacteria)]
MQPDDLFRHASILAMSGWLVLTASILLRWRMGRDVIAGLAVPGLLSVGYVAIIGAYWSSAQGGFGSLAEVAALFGSRWMLLAGWVHYLAFDLFLGAWIARDAEAHGVSRWLVLPLLPATLLFGPLGLALWLAMRLAMLPNSGLRRGGGSHANNVGSAS